MTAPTDTPAVSYGQDRNLPDPTGWVRGTIPVVVVEGMRTGDGRLIPEGTLSGHRALPLALLSLSRTSEGGHLDATVFGRIDHLERVPGPSVMNIDTGQPFPEGTFVWRSNEAYADPEHPDYRLLYNGALTGISVDLAETEADFEFDEDDPDAEPLLQLVRGRIAASTLCTIPAFPGAHFLLPDDAPAPGAGVPEPAPVAASAGPSIRLEHESATRQTPHIREGGASSMDECPRPAPTAAASSSSASAPVTAPRTTPGSAAGTTSAHPATAPSPATPARAAAARPSSAGPAAQRATRSATPAGSTAAAAATARTTTRTATPRASVPSGGTARPVPTRTAVASSSSSGTTSAAAQTSPGRTSPSSGAIRAAGARSAGATSPRTGSPARATASRSTTTTSPGAFASGSASRATSASAGSATTPTAHAAPPRTSNGTPPIAWFRDPELSGPTPLTVDPDGRCYGHIAIWESEHIGYAGQRVLPPRSHSDYAHFHTGGAQVVGDDGATVTISVGRLTLNTGHADLSAGAQAAAAHYDDTGTIAALVCAGEDEHGIWFSGAVDPDLDEIGHRRFLACGLSGDWRPIPGLPEPELVAALSVPTPGFPIPRVRVAAAGTPLALVAAGAIRPREDTMADDALPAEDAPIVEPGTPVAIGDTDLVGVVTEVLDGTAIVAAEVPLDRLTPAEATDEPVEDQLAAMRTAMGAMAARMRTLEAQRVLDRV